jgi:hypothetical protein
MWYYHLAVREGLHRGLVTAVSVRHDYLGFATATTARVLRFTQRRRAGAAEPADPDDDTDDDDGDDDGGDAGVSAGVSAGAIRVKTVEFGAVPGGGLGVVQPGLEQQGADAFEVSGPRLSAPRP